MRWCCRVFIISTSRSTLRRSPRLGMPTNLAANCRFVAFSRHRYTVPNLPLQRIIIIEYLTIQMHRTAGINCNNSSYLPSSRINSYLSSGFRPRAIFTVRVANGDSFSVTIRGGQISINCHKYELNKFKFNKCVFIRYVWRYF